jgi:hypothetical protein
MKNILYRYYRGDVSKVPVIDYIGSSTPSVLSDLTIEYDVELIRVPASRSINLVKDLLLPKSGWRL